MDDEYDLAEERRQHLIELGLLRDDQAVSLDNMGGVIPLED